MATQPVTKLSVARAYCEKYPKISTRQLSRIIYSQNKALFQREELARGVVNTVRGKNGDGKRKKFQKNYGDLYQKEPSPITVSLPESKNKLFTPFILPDGKGLFMSDMHIPFHVKIALLAAVEYGKKNDVDYVFLNGDICDFYSLSKFDKNPTVSKLRNELTDTRQFLIWLREQFPGLPIYYKLGNHDEWFERYLWGKAGELVGVPAIQLPHILTNDFSNLERICATAEPAKLGPIWEQEIDGITFIGDQRFVMAGDLPVLHGHELGKSFAPPVNAARGAFLKSLNHVLIGHQHQKSEHSEKTLMGRIITTYSTGCLCGLTPPYARVNKWGHGCAIIEHLKKSFQVDNRRIIDGKIY
jgi:hypothetical protein